MDPSWCTYWALYKACCWSKLWKLRSNRESWLALRSTSNFYLTLPECPTYLVYLRKDSHKSILKCWWVFGIAGLVLRRTESGYHQCQCSRNISSRSVSQITATPAGSTAPATWGWKPAALWNLYCTVWQPKHSIAMDVVDSLRAFETCACQPFCCGPSPQQIIACM